ncbi:DNA uptake porin HofQ [Candidatus Symbiopectobacterium sp. NZEC151]|uniref:DNA uptake porin HofQ n=1 Tax=Candidatus Symbiopectobacterium sp. NZEC151 TaxID=2820470 RepID=UPI0022272C8C|nr:DNA uptake porin HofQ [Candidatus Symbiopectobacterium sp. NZEC151]MCW2476962.1 DNA uptake porin HofQ [Candidatus Symbiopectobacterium sp. NZEC151]
MKRTGTLKRVGVLLCALLGEHTAFAKAQTPIISLAFDDAPVQKIVQALAEHQRLNVVVAPDVNGVMSLRLNHVPWQQALDIVALQGALSIERKGNVLLVSSRAVDVRQTVLENRFFTLQYADAQEVASSVLAQRSTLLSDQGSVSADTRTNALLVRDTPAIVQSLQTWIDTLDRPVAQVQLAAHIVTISSDSLRELGVSWGMGEPAHAGRTLRLNDFTVNLPVESPAGSVGFNLARLNGRLLDLELSALEHENQVEIIASPRLFTAHKQMASIKQGTEIPYQVSSGASGATAIQFKEAVLGMEVTPTVLPEGKITLNLKISQNMPGVVIKQSDNGETLAIDKQEIQTQVTVSDGETIVLGGIFQQQKNRGERKVPLLGDVPLLGSLFQHQRTERKRRELVIFITPTLVATSP